MIRVLHLNSTDADFQTRRSVEYLTHDVRGGIITTVRTVGPGGDYPNPPTAALAMQSWHHEDFDVVHAWGKTALISAVLAGWRQILYSPPPEIRPRDLCWVTGVLRRRQIPVVGSSDVVRRIFVHHGISPDLCQSIHPAVDLDIVPTRRDARLRAQLGFDESDYVILVPGETTENAEHRAVLWACAILHTMDSRYRALFWGRGPNAKSLGRYARRLQQPNLFTSAEHRLKRFIEFEQITAVADAVVIAGKNSFASLPVCICMAAGLPIVAGASPVIGEFLEDNRTALIVPNASPRTLAQRIVDLRNDPALQRQLGENAISLARTHKAFSIDRFLAQWEAVYQAAADRNLAASEAVMG